MDSSGVILLYIMHTYSLVAQAKDARSKTVRIIVKDRSGVVTVGSGFFISPKKILTCAHVLLNASELNILGATLLHDSPNTPIEVLFDNHFQKEIIDITVEKPDGTIIKPAKIYFDALYDIGLLECTTNETDLFFNFLNIDEVAEIGTSTFLSGFASSVIKNCVHWPFVINSGYIQGKVTAEITGYQEREYLQISGYNLPGNSGGPLISTETGNVIGMMNGYMYWGEENMNKTLSSGDGFHKIEITNVFIPLGIGYATSSEMLKMRIPFLLEKRHQV